MPALRIPSPSKSLPLKHGILQVGGAVRVSSSPTDAYDVIVDDRAELTVVLVDVEAEPGVLAREGLRFEALNTVCQAVRERAPIYELVSSLRAFVACEARTSAGIALLRFSQPDARVEILNAGMPPIACVLPDGRLTLHAQLSPAVGRRLGDVHPYELAPLVWGSSWLVLSDGMTGGSSGPDAVRAVIEQREFSKRRAELAGLDSDALGELLFDERPKAGGGDESVLVVHTDPTRFRSGIV